MVFKTYINKFATIIKDSEINTGINAISEILYGKNVSRGLIYFDLCQLQSFIDEGRCPDISKMRHVLKITNAGSIDFTQVHLKETSSIDDSLKRRASSFDLLFFVIPKTWDRGKGFDYSKNFFNIDFYSNEKHPSYRLVSTQGCNWFNRRSGIAWDEEGVYSNETLSNEYDNFSSERGSDIVIARQRFDIGNENIEVDITETVNKMLSGEIENNGIGICFTPQLERTGEAKNSVVGSLNEVENYIGFLTDKTHTYFSPYLETTYDEFINDDRNNFVLDKVNRLYLYSNIGGKPTDLDVLPTCSIKNDNEETVMENLEVKRQFTGVYYVELSMSHDEVEENIMFYDVWSNIVYNGRSLPDVELDFTIKPSAIWFNIDNTIHDEPEYTPLIAGVNANEDIHRNNEIRKVTITARPSYTTNIKTVVDEMYYRIYTMDGKAEITAIPTTKVHKAYNENFFYIYFDQFMPQKYYIDVTFKYNGEVRTFKDVVHFTVTNDKTNKFA
jgi:hypothetical protein